MDKDLRLALSILKKDGVEIKIPEPKTKTGDQRIIIRTKNCQVVLGASDLGVWLENLKARKN